MHLKRLKISNFRCYKDETAIDLDDLVVFVGRNDSGKSSIFDALDIFFEGKNAPDKDDVCVYTGHAIVRITCIFDEFPKQLVLDVQNPTNLVSEYLVNSDGFLEIVKEYEFSSAKPKSKIYAHAKHPTAEGYSDLLSLTNAKLKQRASSLSVDLSSVNQTINAELRHAIWEHAEELELNEIDIELKTEEAKAIWDQLKKNLPVYAVFKSDRPSTDQDAEAQDPMKAAVKEAIKSQEETLNVIAEKVKAEVQEIADRTVEKIREMNPKLANQLTPRVSNKNWDSLFSVNLTGDENIPINKRGSGTRRLVLLNFFRAKAEKEAKGKHLSVIYAIEEPETSQHPHNQALLVKAFEDLAERPGCQVMLTTHTPMLARRFDQARIRLVTDDNNGVVIRYGSEEETIAEIVESLGVLPDHKIKVFMGVEGRNDISFLRSISRILHDAGEDIPNLEHAEDSGELVFIPLGGSCLDLWISRLEHLSRPEFYLMDRDTKPPDNPRYKSQADAINLRDKCKAWHTNKRELENYLHKDLILNKYPDYSGTGDDYEDVPLLFAKAVHEASDSNSTWDDVTSDSEKLDKKLSRAKKRLNTEFVDQMTSELLSSVDVNNDLRNWLKEIGAALGSDK